MREPYQPTVADEVRMERQADAERAEFEGTELYCMHCDSECVYDDEDTIVCPSCDLGLEPNG